MKEWYELKNYRKKYERFYCEEIPEGYEVHHLDMNRGNSRISNLIAIPKELHRRYHETMTNLELSIVSGGDGSIKDVFMVGMSNGACNMDVMLMSDMIEATSDLSKFAAGNQRRFYETLMQRSVESGISEIFLQNM